MSELWRWLTSKPPEPPYRYTWVPLIPFFSGKLSIDTFIGLVTAIEIGSYGILLLRQRDKLNQLDQLALRRPPALYKVARAAIFGVLCGGAGVCIYLIVAFVLISTQQIPSSDAIAFTWTMSLISIVIGFGFGLLKPTQRKQTAAKFWMYLGVCIIFLVLFLGMNAGTHLGSQSSTGIPTIFIFFIFLAIGAQFWESVSIAIQRHGRACAIFLISSAAVLVGATLVLQFVASATSG